MPANAPDPVDRPGAGELAAEQAYLATARQDLEQMRTRTAALTAMSGDRISAEVLEGTLAARIRALTDDPGRTLFFGRTDSRDGDRWYIGRRHVADDAGDPVVVDWRADVSRGFYRASPAAPMDLVRRRRFGVEGGTITGFEDEPLDEPSDDGPAGAERFSQVLAREIERPRVGPMRDIVATIQPEQDEIVRADLAVSVCVQGAPGTGKTAVGLHRAAWLLYAFADRLARTGVLVVGPSEAFLEHVGAVLPALGEIEVRHTTAARLTSSVPVRRDDEEAAVATLKGDARMAEVLRRAVWSSVDPAAVERGEPLVLPRGIHRWRVPAHELAELVGELSTRGVRYSAARALLPQRIAHRVLLRMERAGDSPDDRVQDAVARSREVKAWVKAAWPVLTPESVLAGLLGDADRLTRCAAGVLDDDEQALLRWETAPRSPRTARWTAADAVLADEVADLLERTSSLGHVVLDEAQDLSPMQLRAVGRRASTGSMTVLGDIAQGTTPWATDSWEDALRHLGQPDAELEVLVRGFRVPSSVIDLAARLLPSIAPGLERPVSVRRDPGSVRVVAVPDLAALWPAVVDAVRAAGGEEGSVGVVVADAVAAQAVSALTEAGLDPLLLGRDHEDAAHRVHVVPAALAKGLEFDRVVVVEPAAVVAGEADRRSGLRRLYVVLTRAVTGLTVVHHAPLPEELA